ncbi:MAG TPA: C40 family peptidase [Pyrinomonadaceae bacterium]|jgi:cell wall-associated NlpC family hydrolase
MTFKRIFPSALAVCFALSLFAVSASAQTDTRLRQVTNLTSTTTTTTAEPGGVMRLENDPVIISVARPETAGNSLLPTRLTSPLLRFDQLLYGAIDQRLGAHYVWGAAGPRVFDCSGFVWSSFQAVGLRFDRGSARTYWARFAAPREGEEFKFGTLVFFNGQTHVGIVADEHGFYHASRSKGVVYSPFNQYWLSRIDGFRRVPLTTELMAAAE